MVYNYLYINNIENLNFSYRMDDDQCARKNAQRFFDVVDPDYYEFEGKYCYLFIFSGLIYFTNTLSSYVKKRPLF